MAIKNIFSLFLALFCFALSHSIFANNEILTGPGGNAFYTPPSYVTPGKHGDLIWIREINTSVAEAKAWKILYWSTTEDNQMVPVSGFVIVPTEPSEDKELYPVITWGHGTTGIPRNCAPSLVNDPASDASFYYLPNSDADIDYGVPALSKMIDSGYAVVATDYNGLGAPGTHQYLIGQTEARNMLDAVIAAQQIPEAKVGNKIISLGWSQGGQGAIWTAQIPEYLGSHGKLLGAVALAPINMYEENKIIQKKIDSGERQRSIPSVERIMGWYAMTRVYPELRMSDVLTPIGMQYFSDAAKSQCNHQMGHTLSYLEKYAGSAIRTNPANQNAWAKRYIQNSLGITPVKIPLAIFQGDADIAVLPAATTAFVNKACNAGTIITYILYNNADHILLSLRAETGFLKWIADRFAGKIPPSTCPPRIYVPMRGAVAVRKSDNLVRISFPQRPESIANLMP